MLQHMLQVKDVPLGYPLGPQTGVLSERLGELQPNILSQTILQLKTCKEYKGISSIFVKYFHSL